MNMNNLFASLEEYARVNNVPIMQPGGINYIMEFIKEKKIKTVLEIGTAIGYSALKMSSVGAIVTSIERDEVRYNEAVKNVNASEYKVNLIFGDALDVEVSGLFDLILIDAAKGKNKEFLDKYKVNLSNNGYILIDNMDYHGLVGKSNEILKRRTRSLVRKIENFIEYMNTQDEFKVTKIEVGDGLYLLERNNNE